MRRAIRRIGVTILLCALAGHSLAQQIGQNAPPSDNTVFKLKVRTQLVVETVSVKDKQGNPIQGLTEKDFTITEDGVPQTIRFCESQLLPETPNGEPIAPFKPDNLKLYRELPHTQIAPETPGKPRYRGRRLLALYFDMTAMQPTEQIRALTAAEKFIKTQMTAADLVAIMRYTGAAVDVLQDFTADRNRILSILNTMIIGEGQGSDEAVNDASTSDVGAAFGQDDGEFNIFNTNRQLAALQTAARMLGELSEKKSLIYFASGLRLNGIDNQAQLHATIDSAIRADVSFWPIDARGLVAQAPLGDATRESPGNIGMYSGVAATAVTTDFQQSQDTLYALAGDTGGKSLLDYNDLTKGIVDAQRSVSSYYILGYYTSNSAQDGKFRRIKVSLNTNTSANLDYRHGYYAGKTFDKFTAVDKERQLEDALMLEDPMTELTIAMEINYFQLNRAEYFVPIVVKIPGRELALAKSGGASRTLIDFIGEIKDVYSGKTLTNVRDKISIKLSDATALELARRPIEYDTGFTLLPGKYMIKFLARDDETGRIGTYQTNFTIPNLNKEQQRIPISSVVLSSQRVDLKDALYNVKDKQHAEAVNPLVQGGTKLIPSVTRVFSKSRDMYIYLQAYEPNATAIQPLIAFVSFYRDQAKVFETQPTIMTRGLSTRLKTVPLSLGISNNPLAPGQYECQVTVLDPAGHKAAFWRAPVKLVP
jgi:VWFA-related protein